jgi:hypothetical protein
VVFLVLESDAACTGLSGHSAKKKKSFGFSMMLQTLGGVAALAVFQAWIYVCVGGCLISLQIGHMFRLSEF